MCVGVCQNVLQLDGNKSTKNCSQFLRRYSSDLTRSLLSLKNELGAT